MGSCAIEVINNHQETQRQNTAYPRGEIKMGPTKQPRTQEQREKHQEEEKIRRKKSKKEFLSLDAALENSLENIQFLEDEVVELKEKLSSTNEKLQEAQRGVTFWKTKSENLEKEVQGLKVEMRDLEKRFFPLIQPFIDTALPLYLWIFYLLKIGINFINFVKV